MIDDQVQLQAIEPSGAALAFGGLLTEYFVALFTLDVTDLQLPGVYEVIPVRML